MKEIPEAQLNEILDKLGKGESVTMDIGDEQVTYINMPEAVRCPGHYFEFQNDEGNGFHAYKCQHCPNGKLIDPKKYEVKDGQIVRL